MTGSGRSRLVALAAAGLLLLAGARPAAAGSPPFDPEWRPVTCATGELTGYGLQAAQPSGAVLALSGWIQPCDPEQADGGGFLIIRYYPLSAEHGRAVPYGIAYEPTGFDLRVALPRLPEAVCLAYDRYGRVACLGIEPQGPDGTPAAVPISTDDPRVAGDPPVVVVTDPHCGTCV
jgi:hypothetical protein